MPTHVEATISKGITAQRRHSTSSSRALPYSRLIVRQERLLLL
jgi:hypothetical protein